MNQRDGLSNENRRAFWQQAICSANHKPLGAEVCE